MSKTVDELEELFDEEFRKHPAFRRQGKRAGIIAVVRALRDESYACDYGDEWLKMLDDILGSDAGEKVAGGTSAQSREAGYQTRPVEPNPATAPAPAAPSIARFIDAMQKWAQEDPAGFDDTLSPDVCEWTKRGRNEPGFYNTPHGLCHINHLPKSGGCWCGNPIKFTEAK